MLITLVCEYAYGRWHNLCCTPGKWSYIR